MQGPWETHTVVVPGVSASVHHDAFQIWWLYETVWPPTYATEELHAAVPEQLPPELGGLDGVGLGEDAGGVLAGGVLVGVAEGELAGGAGLDDGDGAGAPQTAARRLMLRLDEPVQGPWETQTVVVPGVSAWVHHEAFQIWCL